MIHKDQKIHRLKRRIAILIIICFGLGYWLRQKYLDDDFLYSEIECYQNEIIEKDLLIDSLQSQLNPIEIKINQKKNEEKKETKINTKKEKIIKDSITANKPDSLVIIQDTLK